MNPEGRQILYRVSIRCAVEWGAALYRSEAVGVRSGSRVGIAMEPFEAVAWHDALYVVDALYHGWPITDSFKSKGETNNGKPGK